MRILWAVDGSQQAAEAGRTITDLADDSAELIALAVVPHDPLPWLQAPVLGVGTVIDAEREAQLRTALQDGVRDLNWPLERAQTRLEIGKVSQVIVEIARTEQADLIVLGARADGSASEPVGPTANEVLIHAPCPVLIVQRASPCGVVLLATDGSPVARAAEEFAATVLPADALVHVRSIVADKLPLGARPSGTEILDEELRARALVDEAADRVKATGMSVTRATATGRPAAELVRLAAELEVDLVVLGTHGHTGWRRSVIGSVAGEVARTSPASVLIVPPPGE
jgi:nucleotide-binding universal stress UspA family protein